MRKFLLAIISIILFPATWLAAQPTVSIITIGPGDDIYELEGHTLLRINDGDNYDIAVSWGVFDFNSPNFIYRFVKGETDYKAVAYEWEPLLTDYILEGRSVDEQLINLTPDEVDNTINIIRANLLPENCVYRYNYVKDNCATRPLAVIEKAIRDSVYSPTDSLTHHTWRSEMTRYHSDRPWYQFGIDLALGSGIDKHITTREMCYAPIFLHQYLESATRPDGRPLVIESHRIVPERLVSDPTPFLLSPITLSWLWLMMTMWLAMRCIARRQVNRIFTSIFYGLTALAGLILTFLIFISSHEATSPNWLYLWLNPLAFIPAIFVWLKKYNLVVYCYQIVNFVLLIVLLLIGIFGIQALNPALYPIIASYLVYSATCIYLLK